MIQVKPKLTVFHVDETKHDLGAGEYSSTAYRNFKRTTRVLLICQNMYLGGGSLEENAFVRLVLFCDVKDARKKKGF